MGCTNDKYEQTQTSAKKPTQSQSNDEDAPPEDRPADTSDRRGSTVSTADLGGLYEELKKQYPSGKLTKDEFKKCYFGSFPDGDDGGFTDHTLRTFDADSDGTIDFREFICALNLMSKGSPAEKMKWAFTLYDLDNDGYITRAEATEIIISVYKMKKASGDKIDDNVTPEQKVDEMFRVYNSKDGRISLDEFIKGSQSDSSFVKFVQ